MQNLNANVKNAEAKPSLRNGMERTQNQISNRIGIGNGIGIGIGIGVGGCGVGYWCRIGNGREVEQQCNCKVGICAFVHAAFDIYLCICACGIWHLFVHLCICAFGTWHLAFVHLNAVPTRTTGAT